MCRGSFLKPKTASQRSLRCPAFVEARPRAEGCSGGIRGEGAAPTKLTRLATVHGKERSRT